MNKVECAFGCGRRIDPHAPGVFVRTEGWVENRSAGGGHAIAIPKRYREYACPVCIDRLRAHVSPMQGTLLP